MICLDLQPFSIVTDAGFQAYTRALEPRYVLPIRKKLSSDIVPEMYDICSKKIAASLCDATSLAITTDMWTSVNGDSYMSVTGHTLTTDFLHQTWCLQVEYFPEQHTANHLAAALQDSINKWMTMNKKKSVRISTVSASTETGQQLRKIPIFVVSDNASNIVAAMKQLPDYKHSACFIHTLQLAINKAIKDTTGLLDVITKGKRIAAYFHRSTLAKNKLKNAQASLKTSQHKLIQECPTRWNSGYEMMNRLVEQREPIALVLSTETKVDNLTPLQWMYASSFCHTMKPFKEVTVMMSAESYPTSSLVIPVLNVLLRMLPQMQDGIAELQHLLAENIHERWPNYELNPLFVKATVTDPRFKAVVFSEANKAVITDLVLREMIELRESQANTEPLEQVQQQMPTASQLVPASSAGSHSQQNDSSNEAECYDSSDADEHLQSQQSQSQSDTSNSASAESPQSFWSTLNVCK